MADHGRFGDDGFGNGFHRHIANHRRGFVNADERNIADIDPRALCDESEGLLNAEHVTQRAFDPGGFRQRAVRNRQRASLIQGRQGDFRR